MAFSKELWGVVLVIAGFAISVAGLSFPSPTPLLSGIIGLGLSLLGALIYYRGR